VLFPVLLVGAERDARVKAERDLVLRSQALAEFVPAEAGEVLSVRRGSWTIPPGTVTSLQAPTPTPPAARGDEA
jgi:hypothetical protein